MRKKQGERLSDITILQAYSALKNDSTEQSIIAGLLVDIESNSYILGRLSPDDFLNPFYRSIYEAIQDLYSSGEEVNIAMVSEKIKVSASVLAETTNYYTNTSTLEKLVELQEIRGWLKKYLVTIEDVVTVLCENREDLENTLSRILELWERPFKDRKITASDEINDIIAELKEQLINSDRMSTGYTSLDEVIDGFKSGELILVASRPSVGKTALVINFIWNLLLQGNACGFFSIEMDKLSILIRLFSVVLNTPMSTMRRLLRDDPHYYDTVVNDFQQKLKCPFLLNCDGSITVDKVRQIATAWKSRYGIKAIFLDYLQLLKSNYGYDNRAIEVGLISRDLKLIAKDLNIPVIAVSQLNRALEVRSDKVPQLSDLRESGALEQDADIVIMLSREDYYQSPDMVQENIPLELYIRKNRNGPLGKVVLHFNKATNLITEIKEFAFEAE